MRGAITSSAKYSVFGSPLSESEERFGFSGKEEDETALKYFGARYYDSSLGRFLRVDPAKDGVNWFTYAENNPLSKVDPDGREAFTQGTNLWIAKAYALLGGIKYVNIEKNKYDASNGIHFYKGEGYLSIDPAIVSSSSPKIDRIKHAFIEAFTKAEIPKKSWPKESDWYRQVILRVNINQWGENFNRVGTVSNYVGGEVHTETGFLLMPRAEISIDGVEILEVEKSLQNLDSPKASFIDGIKNNRFKPILKSKAFKGMLTSLPAVNIIGDGIDTAMLMNDPRANIPIGELPDYTYAGVPTVYSLGNVFWPVLQLQLEATTVLSFWEKSRNHYGYWYNEMKSNDPVVENPLRR